MQNIHKFTSTHDDMIYSLSLHLSYLKIWGMQRCVRNAHDAMSNIYSESELKEVVDTANFSV